MKKSLVALAVLAATSAFAQSTVGIKGTFDPSIANEKTTYGSGKSVTQNYVRNNTQGTSQITFFGTEDLGDGMKANFLFENDFDTRFDANGNPFTGKSNFGSRGGEQFLGLEGGFGNLQIGAPNTPTLDIQAGRQPFSTKVGSGFGTSLGTSHVRNNNALVYKTPSFNGVTVAYGNAFATKADVNAAGAYNISTGDAATVASLNTKEVGRIGDLSVNYVNGALRTGISFYTVEAIDAVAGSQVSTTGATTAAGKNKQTNLFVQYDIAGATLYFGQHTESTDGATAGAAKAKDASGTNFAVKYAVTPQINLLFNSAKLNDKLTANKDITTTAIGAQYMLSKRTVAYIRSVNEKTDNETGVTAVQKLQGTYIGVQHNF